MKQVEISAFEKAQKQLSEAHAEVSILSKKSPDGAMNVFKLELINQILCSCNYFLQGEYKPLYDFDKFDTDNLPTNSDVVFVIAQYLGCLQTFEKDHTTCTLGFKEWIKS